MEVKMMDDYVKGTDLKRVRDTLSSDVTHVYSTGCSPLDISIGGGLYAGKIYELYGMESQGKTTLALSYVKAFYNYWTKLGVDNILVLWIECESALDVARAAWMGVPVDSILIKEAETIEDAEKQIVGILKKAEEKGTKVLVVYDTIAAAPTKREKEDASAPMIEKPKIIRSMLRKITTYLGKTDSTLILINQEIGGPGDGMYPESPGGGGIKFHSSIRTYIKKLSQPITEILPNGEIVERAIISQVWHVKNKLTTPRMRVNLVINNELGLDSLETTLRFLQQCKLVDLAGSWKSFECPESYAIKEGKNMIRAPMTKITYQSNDKLKEIMEFKYPHAKDWLDYLVYLNYAKYSPLVKVRIIQNIWEYENKFFGCHQTKLDEKELNVAQLMHKQLNLHDMLEDDDNSEPEEKAE